MKRIISLLLAIIVLMGTAVIAEDKITVIINGCTLESETSPGHRGRAHAPSREGDMRGCGR